MNTRLYIQKIADGERYIGTIGDASGVVNHIILLPGETTATLAAASAWAKSIGGELPTRAEQALMFATAKDEFEPYWYWSCEKEMHGLEWAWGTGFDCGGQYEVHVNYENRARAVRRITS